MTVIALQLQAVLQRVAQACQACGRAPTDVTLLAVSKTFGPEAVRAAAAAGQRAFGENYIREAVDKMAALQGLGLEWHCIGPIQGNKTRLVAEHFAWAQTVDRLRIAERLSEQRPPHLPPLQVCLQVNIDGGATKSGAAPDEVPELARAVAALPGLRLRGLMCIPDPQPDARQRVEVFARARRLYDALRADGLALDTLSMGMSGDLEEAIEAGSTMVRVGTAIFGAR